MPTPTVTDRIMTAPATALRTLFAGIGRLLLIADKVRGRVAGQQPAPEQDEKQAPSPAPAAPAGAGPGAEGQARPAAGPGAEGQARPAAPAVPVQPAMDTGNVRLIREPATPPHATRPSAAPAAPPIPGYDDLSIPSLRARLRVLGPASLRAALAYEREHAGREAVISMFERRLAKIEPGNG